MSQTGILTFLVALGCHAIVLLGFKLPSQGRNSKEKVYLEVSLALSTPLKERSLEAQATPAPRVPHVPPPESPSAAKSEPAVEPSTRQPAPPPEPPPIVQSAAPTIEPTPLAEPKPMQPTVSAAENSEPPAHSPQTTQTLGPVIGTEIRKSGNTTTPYKNIEQPQYLKRGKPAYPSEAKRLKQEGTVVLALFINERGGLDKIEVVQSSGFPLLDQAAIEAERRSRFSPASFGGEPTACKAEVPYRFVLPK